MIFMVKIEIEIPDEIAFLKDRISKAEWSFLAMRVLQEKLKRVVRYNQLLDKSQATEKDAEELSDEIKEAVWKHYKNTK